MSKTNKTPAASILKAICDEHSHNGPDYSKVKEAIQELNQSLQTSNDVTLDFDGNEYRIIADSEIWGIYVDTIKELVNDCYDLKLDSIPSFISFKIDWEQTAKNAYADGYGHTFSGYDGSEIKVKTKEGDYWIFRTN